MLEQKFVDPEPRLPYDETIVTANQGGGGEALRRFGLAASGSSVAGYLAVSGVACCLAVSAPSMARADDDAPKPAPRTAITIGGASVVLVAANDKLYAFVDRIEDNSPLEDGELSIDTAEGGSIAMRRAPITMNKATAGLFVGPLDRRGHMQDAFMVSLRSSEGSGEEPAEIIYNDIPDTPAINAAVSPASKVAVAVVSGGIGAIATVLVMLWLRGVRKRESAGSVGPAHAA